MERDIVAFFNLRIDKHNHWSIGYNDFLNSDRRCRCDRGGFGRFSLWGNLFPRDWRTEGFFCIFGETGITETNEFSCIKNSGN